MFQLEKSMRKNKIVLPADMDKECIALCEALNELPHTETEESCCGHLRSPFRIWLRCSSFTYLAIVARAIDRRYSGTQKEWRLVSETADLRPRFSFMLTSVEPYGTYEEMITDTNRIIANIRYWRENFLEYFQSDGEVTNPGENLALTWEDVAILITIYEAGVDNGDYRRYNDAEWMKEYSQDILRRFNEIKQK